MIQASPYMPDSFLVQEPSREYTPAHNYTQIVVPTQGYDNIFNQALADVMEWSVQNQVEAYNLEFLIQESYRQMGDCYDHSHVKFFHALQGNPGETGVSGYPVMSHLSHINIFDKVVAFRTLFRDAALMFFAIVNPVSNLFPGKDFVYHKYITNGWVFYLTPKVVDYDI